MEAGGVLMPYKIINPPDRDKRYNQQAAKTFEALLNRYEAQGWSLVPVSINGWALLHKGGDVDGQQISGEAVEEVVPG